MKRLFCKTLFFVLFILLIFSLSSSAATSHHSRYLVVVDPAHGGRDRGVKLSKKFSEKDVTLAIAGLLKKSLNSSGNIKVLLTRSDDRYVSTSDRVKIAKRSDTNMFISLHINAGFGRSSSGFEVYFPGFKSPSAGKDKDASKQILSDMISTKYLNESVRLAQIIQKNMGKIFRRKDRGLRNAPILVLEGLTIPAVVLEIGFATNVKDRKRLLDKNTQKSIARALAKSIKEFFNEEARACSPNRPV